jgi:type IV pilus assembly protein PilW
LYQITQVQAASAHLQHNPGVSAPWNPAGGGSLLPKFQAGALVFNLGTPTWRTYSVNTVSNAYQLQVAEVLGLVAGGVPMQIVDDIVDLQAEYGKNTDNDPNNIVDAWNPTMPANAAEWQQVVAIRLAVLARSGNYERPENLGDPCSATTAVPTWSGSGTASSVLTVPGGLPSCYKYRVFETVVPIRNLIWRPA